MECFICVAAVAALIIGAVLFVFTRSSKPSGTSAKPHPEVIVIPAAKQAKEQQGISVEGKWEFQSAELFDEFLVALGCNFGLRQIIKCSRPTEIISKLEGENCYCIENITPLKKMKMNFTLDEEFNHVEGDGRKIKVTVTYANGLLTETQRCQKTGEIQVVVKRKLEDENNLLTTMETKGIVSTHRYTRAVDKKKQ